MLRNRIVTVLLAFGLSLGFFTPAAQAAPANLTSIDTPDLNVVGTVDDINLAVNLTWDAPPEQAGHTLVDWRVRYKQVGSGKWATFTHEPSTVTAFTATDFGLAIKLLFSVQPVFEDATGSPSTVKVTGPTPAFDAVANPDIQAQLTYIQENWNSQKNSTYGYFAHRDCANFASQTLIARGWKMNNSWFNRGGGRFSVTWTSSTNLMRYVKSVDGSKVVKQWQNVKVGDLVFFDWDSNGGALVRDHTGVVTLIRETATGRKIYYSSHTTHGIFQSVIGATQIRHAGSLATFVRPAAKN
mgnify:CR=1 FL=1